MVRCSLLRWWALVGAGARLTLILALRLLRILPVNSPLTNGASAAKQSIETAHFSASHAPARPHPLSAQQVSTPKVWMYWCCGYASQCRGSRPPATTTQGRQTGRPGAWAGSPGSPRRWSGESPAPARASRCGRAGPPPPEKWSTISCQWPGSHHLAAKSCLPPLTITQKSWCGASSPKHGPPAPGGGRPETPSAARPTPAAGSGRG